MMGGVVSVIGSRGLVVWMGAVLLLGVVGLWSAHEAVAGGKGGFSEAQAHLLRGVVMPVRQAKLGFSQTGAITSLPWEGDEAKKGDVIATIDDTEKRIAVDKAELAVISAEAGLAKAQAAMEGSRLKLKQAVHSRDKTARLKKRSIVSDMAVEEADFEVFMAEASVKESSFAIKQSEASIKEAQVGLKTARVALDGCKLVAPADGVVILVESKVGEWIGVGSPVLELADLSWLQLSMDVPPELVEELKAGVITEVLNDEGVVVGMAKVRKVMPFIDAASGLRQVSWEITPKEGQVLSGRYVTLRHWSEVEQPKVEASSPPDSSMN
ncbi:MAG: HlyD family efflux transporter periplasmic adaptor subunit [Magnetococcales bacterium]|nr:HlyD family efflux transporter periplasmic adaptor subunit [Magnetococcales bacterium]